jgi:hypothetical protein
MAGIDLSRLWWASTISKVQTDDLLAAVRANSGWTPQRAHLPSSCSSSPARNVARARLRA